MNGFRSVEYYENQEDENEYQENPYSSFAAFEPFEYSWSDWIPPVNLILFNIIKIGNSWNCMV